MKVSGVVQLEERRPAAPSPVLWGALGGLAALGAFVYFFRLGVPTWLGDELIYRQSGHDFLRGDYSRNLEHTLLAKYIIGEGYDLFGSDPAAVRAPAAVAGLLTGFVLLLFGRRAGGWWAGALVLALWIVLPRPELIGSIDVGRVNIGRYARLEVFMGLFTTVGLLAGWRWIDEGRWRWAVATGAAIGLATACKPPGILVLPAVLATALLRPQSWRRVLAQALAAIAVCLLVVGVTYVPLALNANPFHAIDQMFEVSKLRNSFGRPFVFGDRLYSETPVWANLWWQWKALGTPAAISVSLCLLIAPFVLGRRLALLLLASVLIPAAFLAFGIHYALPYYYYTWEPQLILCCGLVIAELARSVAPARVAAAALTLPLAIAGIGTIGDVAGLKRRDYTAVAQRLRDHVSAGTVVVWGDSRALSTYVHGPTYASNPIWVKDLSAIIVDPTLSTRLPNREVVAYLRLHRRALVRHRVDYLSVYVPRSPAVARRLGRSLPPLDLVVADPRERRKVARVIRCLGKAGLEPRVTPPVAPAIATIQIPLPSGNTAVLFEYGSAPEAGREAPAADRFFAKNTGGGARVWGSSVVALVQEATRRDLRGAVACL